MGQAKLDNLEDYTHFRRIQLSGDLPTYGNMTVPADAAADLGDLGFVLAMGYHYTDAASYGTNGVGGTDQFMKSALPNSHFIHAAFESTATGTTAALAGTARGTYQILALRGINGSGECIRARTFVMAAMGAGTDCHGAHIELRITGTSTGAVGSIVGGGSAIRATLSLDAGATTGGTLQSLLMESNFGQAPTGLAAFCAATDINTSIPMPYFLNIASLTAGSTNAFNTWTTNGGTFYGALRVRTPAGDRYIPLYGAPS
jgi:hypothetical protein